MEVVTLRDLRLGTRELLRVFNSLLRYDFVDAALLETLTVLDPNFREEDLYLAVEDGDVKALAFLGILRIRVPEEARQRLGDRAWIKALGCRERFCEYLRRVLDYVEDRIRSEGLDWVMVYGYAPWYLAPGPDVRYEDVVSVLRSSGYELFGSSPSYLGEEGGDAGRTVDYLIDMERFYIPQSVAERRRVLESKGYSFEDLSGPRVEEVARWVEERFGFVWATETRLSGRRMWAGVVVARNPRGEIAGFAVYGATAPFRFGPIGTDPAERGRGIGTVLLYEALQRIRLAGVRIGVIPWTSHLFFYAGVPGICGVRKYLIFEKVLGSPS